MQIFFRRMTRYCNHHIYLCAVKPIKLNIMTNLDRLDYRNGREVEGKIINFKDYVEYHEKLSEVMESVNDLSDEIFESLFILACLDKWKQWSDNQPVGSEFEASEEMLRNTGDKNIDLLWELLDKIEEVKGKIRVNPRVEQEEDVTEDDDEYDVDFWGNG